LNIGALQTGSRRRIANAVRPHDVSKREQQRLLGVVVAPELLEMGVYVRSRLIRVAQGLG
jgi:hypothetical protein